MTIYLPKDAIDLNQPFLIPDDKTHYLVRVMRCSAGHVLTVIDGEGGSYEAVLYSVSKKGAFLKVTNFEQQSSHPYNTILCQAVLKGDAMDQVIEQSVEIGVSEIYPLVTERTIVRETRKLRRWQKIAEEAVEQSQGVFLPKVHRPIDLNELIRQFKTLVEPLGLLLIKGAGDIEQTIKTAGLRTKTYVVVGPEGGLTEDEVFFLTESGFKPVSIGRFTLKAKTAGPVGLALTHYFLDKHKHHWS